MYRLITEDKNREGIVAIVSAVFDGFTLIETHGYWQGKPENSLIIEIDGPRVTGTQLNSIAEHICILNDQQCVMIQHVPSSVWLINKQGEKLGLT